jgi:hypothetical protein
VTRRRIRATLIGDGTSDRVLVHVLRWILAELHTASEIHYADLGILSIVPSGIRDRARAALKLFPADLLFVHRDAETAPPSHRHEEISRALADEGLRFVPIVPVRMTEAWFLFDEASIRMAAGNPHGMNPLELPPLHRVEAVQNPKLVLQAALLEASGLPTRRRSKFRVSQAFHRLAELIENYGALRALTAFVELEAAIRAVLAE